MKGFKVYVEFPFIMTLKKEIYFISIFYLCFPYDFVFDKKKKKLRKRKGKMGLLFSVIFGKRF